VSPSQSRQRDLGEVAHDLLTGRRLGRFTVWVISLATVVQGPEHGLIFTPRQRLGVLDGDAESIDAVGQVAGVIEEAVAYPG